MSKSNGKAGTSSFGCPMPKLDFEVITLGHGSGGILTHQLLDSGVFNILKNDWLDKQHDGALLQLNGDVAFTTDSFVVTPIFFPGGNIGELAVNGTINDLAMCGAVPKFLSLSFIIEEGLPMTEFWEVLIGIKNASQYAGVPIVTGDTKVVEKGKGDKIYINTSGIGIVHPKAKIDPLRILPGDKILVSGSIANHGLAILSVRPGLKFETTIQSDTQSLHLQVLSLLDHYGSEVKFLRDATRGGLATVLNELAVQAMLGIRIHQSALPLSGEVEGACELLGLDPLFVANEGVFVTVVAPTVAEEALKILLSFDQMAACIGEVTGEHPKQVIQKSTVGGQRVVSMLPGEQLPRIC